MRCGLIFCSIIVLALSIIIPQASAQDEPQGNLIIIGGGSRPDSVMKKIVELAGGDEARIAIIPMASKKFRKAGREYEKDFRKLGAAEATAFYFMTPTDANDQKKLAEMERYTGFFFGGGDQRILTSLFLNTKSLELFHKRYMEGAVIAGTSAGAAIMSSVMITGDGDWDILEKKKVLTAPGLGFIPFVITDQHFVARQRLNRLLAVCIENVLPGFGIDESTALWVKPKWEAEVLGESVIIMVDPRTAATEHPESSLHNVRNIILDIYQPGEIIDLKRFKH